MVKVNKSMNKNIVSFFIIIILIQACSGNTHDEFVLEKANNNKPLNIVFILSDDHRYDFMGFTGKVPFLQTPNMDKMALQGAHIQNAFVTTSLCSPSRASILTGQYAHHHGVVDNQSPIADSVNFFPQYLQRAGYETAFVGKWHMGHDNDEPRKGFDRWVSFRGQGNYYNPAMNVDGERIEYKDSTYITDLLTDYAVDWLKTRTSEQPFFMYLSHKAVHSEFHPPKRHNGKYQGKPIQYPLTMFPPGSDDPRAEGINNDSIYNYKDVPDWVKKQRYSWHGVDYMYHGNINFENFYYRYNETLLAVDESIGRIIEYLEEAGLMESTIIFYMGDNGFSFGEHGLIDKRQAYEESMRVPLLAFSPANIKPGTIIKPVIQNIDIAPTILELAGLKMPSNMDGMPFSRMLLGEEIPWRDKLFYEYFWERPFPQTPTVFAVRSDQYKFIRYQGIWDINEFFDLQNDPLESNNLIRNEEYQDIIADMNQELFDWLKKTNGMQIPLRKDQGKRFDNKYSGTY